MLKWINNYYIDNSIITFNSPELINNESLFEDTNLEFNIVGIIPIHSIKSDIEVFLDSQGLSNGAKVIKNFNNNETLINGNLFRDYQYVSEDPLRSLLDRKYAHYYLYLWNKSESIIGQTVDWELKDNINHAVLKHKTIANKNISSLFLDLKELLGYEVFHTLFPIILTDNGTEFSKPDIIEFNDNHVYKTKLFYCYTLVLTILYYFCFAFCTLFFVLVFYLY